MNLKNLMAVGLVGLAAAAGAAMADDGVAADKVLVGQAAALKGPASALGEGMQAGMTAYFNKVNASGGVNGRKIELKTLNDGYEPEKCEAATKVLLEQEKVFALIGYVGTPTSKVAVPLAEKAGAPFIGAFTGAEFLRSPFNPMVVNVRASYFQETERMAQILVDQKGQKKVACFYQNDAFGQAGLAGIEKALKARGLELCAKGTFERNTVAISEALSTIGAAKPDAVVMVGPYKPCAAFIKAARENEGTKTATLVNISFVGTTALLGELGGAGDGTIITQVVPYPWDNALPAVKEYTEDMNKAGLGAKIDFISLEGYLTAKFFCQNLAKIEGEPTREKFLKVLATAGNFDLGGVKLTFGASDNQGMDEVFATVIQGGKAVPLTGGGVAGVPTDK